MNNPSDEISQSEKRRVLANDRMVAEERRASTYHQQSQASIDDLSGGRFGAMPKATVTGTAPISYPRQPEGSPWASDPTAKEPELGYSVDALDPTGEPHEQTRAEQIVGKRRSWRRL
jgi:hypothetical protein